jgi:hypothetical protein
MTTIKDYRRFSGLLLDPMNTMLATAGDGRYLLDRSVVLRVAGPGAVPGAAAVFGDLPDGAYQVHSRRPPSPGQAQPAHDAVQLLLDRYGRVADWRPVTDSGWSWTGNGITSAVQVLAREDDDGQYRPTAVNARLWHHWLATFGGRLVACQPAGRPGHALKLQSPKTETGTSTTGYIVPVRIGSHAQRLAEYAAMACGGTLPGPLITAPRKGTRTMQATDSDVTGWVITEHYRRSGTGNVTTGPEDISTIIDLAVEQVHEHRAQHLITTVSAWPVAGGDDWLLTVDLASGLRLCTRCISRKQLLQPAGPAGPIEVILANILAAAREMVASCPPAARDPAWVPGPEAPGPVTAWILRRDNGRDETVSLHGSRDRALATLAGETRSRWDNIAGYPGVPGNCDALADADVVQIYYQHPDGLEYYSVYEEDIDRDWRPQPDPAAA